MTIGIVYLVIGAAGLLFLIGAILRAMEVDLDGMLFTLGFVALVVIFAYLFATGLCILLPACMI